MAGRRSSGALFRFDRQFLTRYGVVAGVDEAGRGPLAGPVVAAAVVLPDPCRIPKLNDSKCCTLLQRLEVYRVIQKRALAIGVGVIDHTLIDTHNILQATYMAMRLALQQLVIEPLHVLVDGYPIPQGPNSQTGIFDGDAKSALVAAASIVAKVTRDAIMERWHGVYPQYGFGDHKGYSTPEHLASLRKHGPCPIHRRSFEPVRVLELPFNESSN